MHDDPSTEETAAAAALSALDRSDLVVFAGPSLVGSRLARSAAHLLLPPVREGDLAAIADERPPAAVLMIDGYFGAGQAVNLTEIQETLHRGIRLYGCASMGALRAVEARPWGMIGLGRVFAGYLAGLRTADENVALLHDDEYRALTAPTVNVDLLCELLETRGADPAECRVYRERASALYFGDRSFSALRVLARECFGDEPAGDGPSPRELALHHLAAEQHTLWDAKRHDAEAALADVALGRAPASVPEGILPVPEHPDALLADR